MEQNSKYQEEVRRRAIELFNSRRPDIDKVNFSLIPDDLDHILLRPFSEFAKLSLQWSAQDFSNGYMVMGVDNKTGYSKNLLGQHLIIHGLIPADNEE